MAVSDSTRRVLFITLNGVSHDVLTRLVQLGVMPNVGRLLQSADLTRLRPIYPLCDATAQATFQTGVGPGIHGVVDDHYLDHHRGKILPQRTRRSTRPTIDDSDLSKFDWTHRPKDLGQLQERVAQIDLAMARTFDAACKVDTTRPWQLIEVRLTALERLQYHHRHLFGIDDGPGGNRQWVAKTQEALSSIDNCLGRLLELADRRGASVVVASAYGFVPSRDKITLSELLKRRELLKMTSGPSTIPYRMSRLKWRVQRSILGKFSSVDQLGRTIGSLMPIDWHRSRAVTLHGQQAALVYLNTPERFGTRLLTTHTSREQTTVEVIAAFREALHPVTHEPLFDDVFLTAERFNCDPLELFLPDVIATAAPGFHTRHRLDRLGHLVRSTPSLSATRGGEGLLITLTPDVELGRSRTANASDVASTVVQLLGIAPTPTPHSAHISRSKLAQ